MTADPLLVVVAHPDDEALAFAGLIRHALDAGRRVAVAFATNGDGRVVERSRLGRTRPPSADSAVRRGLRRNREAIAASRVLGLERDAEPGRSQVHFLGYPNGGLATVASAEDAWSGDAAGHGTTWALGRGGSTGGDLRSLLDGRPSQLRADHLHRDLDDLVALVSPAEILTHASFDGHPDHAALSAEVRSAAARAGGGIRVRTALVHPAGTADRMFESAREWPNPPDGPAGPGARFTPHLAFGPPPTPDGPDWGPLGPPHELIETPPAMRHPDPRRNLKWRAIACHETQLDCAVGPDGLVHPSCGYLRAFVKRHEPLWVEPGR